MLKKDFNVKLYWEGAKLDVWIVSCNRPSEARTLAFAIKHKIENDEKTGYITKVPSGGKIKKIKVYDTYKIFVIPYY